MQLSYPWEASEFDPPWGEVVIADSSDDVRASFPEETWYPYFPDVNEQERESYRFPVPLSERFWHEYGEPLQQFVGEARFLANALEVLADGGDSTITEWRDQVLDCEGALRRLNEMSGGVSPTVGLDREGRYVQRWVAPSLLGHLAIQAVQDLLGDRRLLKCRCGAVFSTIHARKKYCSDACANRYRQQSWRAARKGKAGRRRSG